MGGACVRWAGAECAGRLRIGAPERAQASGGAVAGGCRCSRGWTGVSRVGSGRRGVPAGERRGPPSGRRRSRSARRRRCGRRLRSCRRSESAGAPPWPCEACVAWSRVPGLGQPGHVHRAGVRHRQPRASQAGSGQEERERQGAAPPEGAEHGAKLASAALLRAKAETTGPQPPMPDAPPPGCARRPPECRPPRPARARPPPGAPGGRTPGSPRSESSQGSRVSAVGQ